MKYTKIFTIVLTLISSETFGQNVSTDSLLIYEKLIMEADSAHVLANDYIFALKKYEAAHEHMPNEIYPQDKIIQLSEIILYETYKVLISSANTCYKNGNYVNALNNFNRAKEIFPNKTLPETYTLTIDRIRDKK